MPEIRVSLNEGCNYALQASVFWTRRQLPSASLPGVGIAQHQALAVMHPCVAQKGGRSQDNQALADWTVGV